MRSKRVPLEIIHTGTDALRQGKGHHVTLNDDGTVTFTLKGTLPAKQRLTYRLHEIKRLFRTALPRGESGFMLLLTPTSFLKICAMILLAFLVPNVPGTPSLLSWLLKAIIVGVLSMWWLMVPVARIIVEFKDGSSFSGLIPKTVWGPLNRATEMNQR